MSLRGPAAPRRKTWRRSGDESYWDSLTRDPSAPCPVRGSRPQSATEGSQLDGWLQHLQRIQQTSNRDQEFGLDKDASYSTLRAKRTASSSWGSSSGGTSLCGSSLGSRESLQTSVPTPPERGDSFEKARIGQVPKKEQTKVSFLTPVKIGWLPIRRKVTMVGEQGRNADSTGQQVKLKPPITPTLVKSALSSVTSCSDEEVQKSQSKVSAGARTAWNNQDSPIDKQVPEKRSPAAPISIAPVSWQALKRGWRLNRVLALPGSSPSDQTQSRTNSDIPASKNFTQSSNVHQDQREITHRTTINNQSRESLPFKLPLQRTSSVQPLKASHIQTTSVSKTLIPENKAGFSSITISSRKVCRSSSLPSSPPPSQTNQESMDSRQIMVQRKAMIVKVTEQRVTTASPICDVKTSQNQQPSSQNVDTVVRRRKATIIKVTEHRESFTPNNAKRNNEYRHSFTEGLYNGNRISSSQSQHSTPIDSKPIHRSTLNLVVTPPPVIMAPPAKSESTNEMPRKPQRPSSWYGMFLGILKKVT
ncbi:hypothetical protein WMY93_010101 [Mugilogobius chulae]|uniref:Uncharacterized protein n=1 Tax=Mugilogobius chulae TaxID=88201 RepID=A0AAW0P636_9GOBI